MDASNSVVLSHDAVASIVTAHQDSSRGAWTYSEWRPPALAGLVELVWETCGTTTEPQDRHYPHGMFELLVNLMGNPYRLLEPAGGAPFATTWLVGQQLGPVVTAQPARHHVLGIRLRPAGAYALLRVPLRVVTGLVVELEDVVGVAVRELVAQCRDATSIEARFETVTAWLGARLAGARRIDPAIAWAADEIEAREGSVGIASLRREIGLSKTRLATAFRDQIGVTPKLYARLVRFRRALAMIEGGARSLADVALAAGYYDQPHFNAEFRELTGQSPRELLVARYPSGVPIPVSPG
jgi:AraC-like DNA-binding protein